ncbi:MAG: aminopeptidase [Chitinispirillaceae bacterium]|jgi:aminopeptidase|nr:aminopeptidase [Chitinispirillaceae bacterium]
MYQPSQEILEKYAAVLVNFALNDGMGIKKDDVVLVGGQVPGMPLIKEVYRAVIKSGGYPIVNLLEDDLTLIKLVDGTDEHLSFFPEKYYRGIADTIDHSVRILADRDPLFLSSQDPRKIMLNTRSTKPYRDWLDAKEDAGKFTWTLCLYGTEGLAKEAGMSVEAYWEQIENACFLREADPIAKWKSVYTEMSRILTVLNEMPVDRIRIESKETDLTIVLGQNRRWLGGRGRNVPSFEIFTSPDWRTINGKIFFDLPLYRYGQIIEDIRLEIKDGIVIKATAGKNEAFLKEMISQKNADKIGEFSLTDRRFSRISKFMAETLFDENFGGEFGNTHLAVGRAYHDACSLDPRDVSEKQFIEMGFNDSPEHTDIIATADRVVTATLRDKSSVVIYTGGEFVV